jgi:hypothetical protein
MIPSYGITVGNFFHALEPGGALSDWGYNVVHVV